ncbi:MAG: LamG domain-containing protein [Fidelibacterota bacterium]|nr:MAG: LamG domain-containing protein [Candidatus Neomarinimicrobiota bacterium]
MKAVSMVGPGRAEADHPIIWDGERLMRLADRTVLGQPKSIASPYGPALEFDGEQDGLLLPDNPLIGWEQFTVEVMFKPDFDGQVEQRFLHMGEVHGPRLLFELRVEENKWWYLDTFLSSGDSSKTMMNEGYHHVLGRWYHAALTCDGTELRNYVNGDLELKAAFDYVPMGDGQTSIGVRQNKVSWFKGCIGAIRIKEQVIAPAEFLYNDQKRESEWR